MTNTNAPLTDNEIAVLAKAQRALKAGESVAWVNDQLKSMGVERSYQDLLAAARTTKNAPDYNAFTSGDVLHAMAKGASLNAVDKVLPQSMVDNGKSFDAQHPGPSLASKLVGGLQIGILTGPMMPAWARELPLLARVPLNGVPGAGLGAVADAMESENAGEILPRLKRGAAYGALGGVIGGTAAEALGVVGGAILSKMNPATAAGRAAIKSAAERAGLSADDFKSVMQELTKVRPGEAVPADASPALARLLRTTLNDGSGDVAGLVDQVSGRVQGAGDRLAEDLRTGSGVDATSASAAKTAAKAVRRGEADALYGPLETAHPKVPNDPRLAAITSDPNVKSLWRKVLPDHSKGAGFAHYQQLVRQLRGAANEQFRKGNGAAGDLLKQKSEDLITVMEDLVPGYRAANLNYAQNTATVSAFDKGASAWTRGLSGSAVKDELATISQQAGSKAGEAEQAYRHGMVDQMLRKILTTQRGRNIGGNIANLGTARREALQQMFPTQGEFEKFLQSAMAENKFSALRDLTLGNSSTAQQLGDLRRWQSVVKKMIESPTFSRRKADEVAKLLLTPGAKNRDVVEALLRTTPFSPGRASMATAAAAGAVPQANPFFPDEP